MSGPPPAPHALRASWIEALEHRRGADYWRGLDDLLETPGFRDAMRREFPVGAATWSDGLSRRDFIKLLGASVALAGVAACTKGPPEAVLPYVTQPPEITPGIPLHYATSMVLGGYATGLLVESHAGRPTKVEGNPEHPASLGAAGVFEQGSVLQLYDPYRARAIHRRRTPAASRAELAAWTAFARAFHPTALRDRVGARGTGLRLLLEPTSSPLIAELVARVRDVYPDARVAYYAPLAAAAPLEGARAALGEPLLTQYDFSRADVVLALDADFLGAMPFHLRYARDFAERRRPDDASRGMNRLYVAEGVPSITGGMADHRLRVRTREVQGVLAAVLAEVMRGLGTAPVGAPASLGGVIDRLAGDVSSLEWIRATARDLRAHAGRSIVVAGDRQPPAVHAMAHALNTVLGNTGSTVWYTRSPIVEAGESSHGLRPLAEEMRAGQVDTLVMLEGNPAYSAPAGLDFARLLDTIPRSVYLGLYNDETARRATWLVPGVHYLESWGDARAYDGTLSVIQPLIDPLYGGKAPSELLAALAGDGDASARTLLRESWRQRAGGEDEAFWTEALHRGLVQGSAAPRVTAPLRWSTLLPLLARAGAGERGAAAGASAEAAATGTRAARAGAAGEAGLEVVFVQDSRVYDGRFADNAWLQELPDPLTKLTWDNAALLSPATAARLGVDSGDLLELRYRGRTLRIAGLVLPGHADDAVSVHFGYGREAGGEVARGVGFNTYRLWSEESELFGGGLDVRRVLDGGSPVRHPLATTQAHWAMAGRPIVLEATLEEYRRNPGFTSEHKGRVLSLYKPFEYLTGDQWAMTIDLATCTGCGGCMVACQAENNVPVVGKEGVLESREMHWLRIDRYFSGPPDDPRVVHEPMLCQHCEKAPCEYVCPVNATVHSPDGLNEMVYNRCVGTRFCSNNCPYKVRRFNWFDYNAELSETERMVKNPQVTVRDRGVMEKCTFCVQRIRRRQIDASIAGRSLRPGEVQTACQQACPTRAIVFGSLTERDSEVARLRNAARSYAVLHELGTEPRVRYLARITNPNPALGGVGE